MKNSVKFILQKMLGFRSYLFTFAKYKIRTLKNDDKENDFFYFLDMLNDGQGNVLDIGANLGIMTVHLAQNLPNSTIHAFEPVPDNRIVFKQVVDKYELKNVEFHEYALGDEDGSVEMITPKDKGAKLQGLSHVKHDTITEWNQGEEFSVAIKRLDDLNLGKVQGIKMDVENFEYFVLTGAKSLLGNDYPIIYTELWDNDNRARCMELLSQLGYDAHVIVEGQLTVFEPKRHQSQNFIYIAR